MDMKSAVSSPTLDANGEEDGAILCGRFRALLFSPNEIPPLLDAARGLDMLFSFVSAE